YGDDDGDGYCEQAPCAPQPGSGTPLPGDCDDGRASVNPGATEVCHNGVDDDCDLHQDEGVDTVGGLVWYRDADRDWYGSDESQCTCDAIGGFVAAFPDDCMDSNPDVFPGQSAWFTNDRGDG